MVTDETVNHMSECSKKKKKKKKKSWGSGEELRPSKPQNCQVQLEY